MTRLENHRLAAFLSREQLGRMVRLPARSVEALEIGEYPLHRIGPGGRAHLEAELQRALNTDRTLPELLGEV